MPINDIRFRPRAVRRPPNFRRNVIIAMTLHLYVGLRLIPDLPIGQLGKASATCILVLSCCMIPLGLLARTFEHHRYGDRLAWVGFVALGFFSSLFVLTFLRDMLLVFAIAAELVWRHAAWPDRWRADAAIGIIALAMLATAIGFIGARRLANVVTVDVPIAELPAGLEGLTIVQISDIHVGATIKAPYVDAIVDAVNRLEAHVIVITGDVVDGSVARLAGQTQPLARLRARYGAYLVTGNHEYSAGAAPWITEFKRLGLHVLLNEHVVLEHNGARFILAGVTDHSGHRYDETHRSDPAGALADAPSDIHVRVLLAHQPRTARAAADAGYTLQLSGHTHGGQFFPWNLFVRLWQPFTSGLGRIDSLWVYTNRGTGYWGPPKRLGVPSEITRLRLVPEST